jgi:hypothetical protein
MLKRVPDVVAGSTTAYTLLRLVFVHATLICACCAVLPTWPCPQVQAEDPEFFARVERVLAKARHEHYY